MPRSPPSSQSRHRSPQQIWKKSYGFHGFSQLQLRKGWRKFSWLLSIYTGLLHRFVHLHYVEPEPGARDSAQKTTSTFNPIRGSVMGALEEVESSLVEWRARYEDLFLTEEDGTRDSGTLTPPCLEVAAAYINLSYEYAFSRSSFVVYD